MKLFKANSDKAHAILMKIKITLGTLAATSFATGSPILAFSLLAIAGLVDIGVSCFSSKEELTEENKV